MSRRHRGMSQLWVMGAVVGWYEVKFPALDGVTLYEEVELNDLGRQVFGVIEGELIALEVNPYTGKAVLWFDNPRAESAHAEPAIWEVDFDVCPIIRKKVQRLKKERGLEVVGQVNQRIVPPSGVEKMGPAPEEG